MANDLLIIRPRSPRWRCICPYAAVVKSDLALVLDKEMVELDNIRVLYAE